MDITIDSVHSDRSDGVRNERHGTTRERVRTRTARAIPLSIGLPLPSALNGGEMRVVEWAAMMSTHYTDAARAFVEELRGRGLREEAAILRLSPVNQATVAR